MVMDHRHVAFRCSLLSIMMGSFALSGCQSVVDPGRSMRPAPVPQGQIVSPPTGPSLPTNSLPPGTSGVERQPATAVLSLPQANADESKYHTVQAGDSWTSIAAKFRLPVSKLTSANGIDASTVLQPGQMIYIPEE